jgi:AAA+ superfamily predicted ATPase
MSLKTQEEIVPQISIMSRSNEKDNFQSFREYLEELIRARTPLFYLGGIEIKRCIQELEIITSRLNAKTQIFHLSRGTVESREEKKATDPIGILDTIMKWVNTTTSEKQTIWVLPFFHLLFQNSDALIISKLRDIVEFNKFNGTVVMIGIPNYKLPPEFVDIPVIEFPIPDRRCIESLLNPNLSKDDGDRIIRACLGFRLREIEDLFSRSMVRHGRIDPSTIEELRAGLIKEKGKTFLDIEFPRENLDQVGGMKVLKDWLRLREIGFINPGLLKERNLPMPKGILLTGVPGCGKSLICKAVAGSWKFPLIRFDPSTIYSTALGSSEKNLFECLELVRVASPCVLWIDEIEKGFSITDPRTDGGVSGRLLGTFLNFLQERDSPVFIVATANDPRSMPSEMHRKGRWDEIFFIDLPDEKERLSIFKILFQKYSLSLRVDPEFLLFSEGFSGAEIEQAVVDACYEALFRNTLVSAFGLHRALQKSIPLSVFMKEKIEALRTWAVARTRPASKEETRVDPCKKVTFLQKRSG